MKFWSAPSLAILAALTTSGCATYGQHGHGHYGHTRHTSGGGEAVALGIGLLAGAALASAADHHPEPEERVIVTQQIYYVNAQPAPALPASTRDRVPVDDTLPSFDPASARGALAATDVTSCGPAGAAAGYGHATVTFNPDGVISKVVIDEPSGLSPEAVRCVGDRLGTVKLAPFRGSLVTVGTVFRR